MIYRNDADHSGYHNDDTINIYDGALNQRFKITKKKYLQEYKGKEIKDTNDKVIGHIENVELDDDGKLVSFIIKSDRIAVPKFKPRYIRRNTNGK